MRNRKFQRNSKKIQKIKKYNCGGIPIQNRLEKAQREKIKIIVPFRSYPTRKRKLKKKTKKFKKLKNPIMASFQAKISMKRKRKRKNKNCLSVSFQLDG